MAEALFDGFWLGLLGRRQLQLVNEAFYAVTMEPVDGAEYTYDDPVHIRSGLFAWEMTAVEQFTPGGSVVVTSAGAGRELVALSDMGFDVHGFEPNESLVKAGRAVLADPDRLQISEWDRFPSFSDRADAVIIGWASYMMLATSATRVLLLEGAWTVLRPGGLLLVSYYDRPESRYFSAVWAVGSILRRLRRGEPLEIGDSMAPNFVHCFTPDEVAAELDLAGFDVVSIARTPYGHALARRR